MNRCGKLGFMVLPPSLGAMRTTGMRSPKQVQSLATQSMVPRPAALASPGGVLEMQKLKNQPRPTEWDLQLNKIPR